MHGFKQDPSAILQNCSLLRTCALLGRRYFTVRNTKTDADCIRFTQGSQLGRRDARFEIARASHAYIEVRTIFAIEEALRILIPFVTWHLRAGAHAGIFKGGADILRKIFCSH